MQALDSSLSTSVTVPVGPFKKGALTLGFTRGYIQSSAYVRHFEGHAGGPPHKDLEFDTNTQAGTNNGQPVTSHRSTTGWVRPRASRYRATCFDNE
jgi:hypothetical protein